jgi:hypothetical protein
MKDAPDKLRIDSTISYDRIFGYFRRGLKEIIACFILFAFVATLAAIFSDKEYLVQGTIKQTDLTDVMQPPQGMNGALGLLTAANNANDRINSYISILTSPEIAAQLLTHDDYIDILFDGKWVRQANSAIWKHRQSISWMIRQGICRIFQIECSDVLSAQQISDELADRVTLEPSATITQGVLTSIGNTDTFDVTIRGKNPRALLSMLDFLHNTANRRIQQGQITLAERVADNLSRRIQHIENAEVREQVISVLSGQEQKLAVLHAGQISYAAAWLVSPTISPWPVRPNILLFYLLALVGAFAVGPVILALREHLVPRKGADSRINAFSQISSKSTPH